MKKILTTTLLLASISMANASMDDCTEAAQSNNWSDVLKYCEKYKNTNRNALGFMIGAYGYYGNGLKAQETAQEYINKYSKNDPNKEILAGYTAGLGNYYYFGEDGAKKDTKKGLQYITKGAELGNITAQEQLGSFYGAAKADGVNKNFSESYYWYTLSKDNNGNDYTNSYVYVNLDTFKESFPTCIAIGDNMVAKAYLDGKGGLPVDTTEAKEYLEKAISLYKQSKEPTANELKYCKPVSDDLNLAGAQKLLASL
ncbi:sel1 repeat family protein [Francisella philomiragia]|uniref:Sel1 repeat family protein n=1 Tax=Francisella philomiragia TaxID=28110 RepID=A0AAW3DD89_9GAMM|nr:SEL1-like repeat protein [Francisella philomiragia]KFJ43617.1 sel1 repeat family protein [Francisella philomiragia]MBK2255662.1 sel1 repeat family protein [Francisella philomiragia]MBK2273975.1 sel1 repeat family protein [Francisella philomiragia]MBK2277816.1 sel1 repeat family protein [Francisella philomiragia]MBK2281762.1 sel1 repeat family protein [Francisella philomiragia]